MEDKNLTPKELEVLQEIINGLSNKSIAKKLFISSSTVKAHISSVFQKLEVKNRVEAAVKGVYMLLEKQNKTQD